MEAQVNVLPKVRRVLHIPNLKSVPILAIKFRIQIFGLIPIFDTFWIKKYSGKWVVVIKILNTYLIYSSERPKPTVHSLLDTFPGVGENTRDSHGENESRPWITIECGFPVLSVAFGTGIPQQAGVTTGKRPKSHWTRFDFSKQTILATGHTNGRIRIWNVQTGTLLLELVGHKSGVRDVAFSPDGSLRLISASLDKTLKVKS